MKDRGLQHPSPEAELSKGVLSGKMSKGISLKDAQLEGAKRKAGEITQSKGGLGISG